MTKKITLKVGYALQVSAGGYGGITASPYEYGEEKLYAIKQGKGIYSIVNEKGNELDRVEVVNGVVCYKAFSISCHLHSLGKLGSRSAGGEKCYTLLSATTKELMARVTKKQPGEVLTTARKLLGMDLATTVKSTQCPAHTHSKTIADDCEAAVYLSILLRGCKTVTVAWGALPNVKDLSSLTHVPTGVVECYHFLDLVARLRRLAGLVTKEGLWYYTSTQEEFNALALMQSYSREIDSCQYFPVHMLDKALAEKLTQDSKLFEALTEEYVDGKGFLETQCKGFDEGVRYFFQLNNEGLVCRRFYAWVDTYGDLKSNNFYGVIARECTIDYSDGWPDSATPVEDRVVEHLSVYRNEGTAAARIPSAFDEENLKAYLSGGSMHSFTEG